MSSLRLAVALRVSILVLLGSVACGDDDMAGDGGGPMGDHDAGPHGDAGGDAGSAAGFLSDAGDGWLSLIEGDWELPPNTEGYVCVRLTAPRDVYLHSFSPIAPPGTHHTLLSVDEMPDEPDGVSECGAQTNGERSIYGSGVGSEPRTYPEGIAVRLEAGEQLLLNLHLFNATNRPLRGRSGTLVKTMDPDDVVHEAESMLAGPIDLEIPIGRSTQSGQCTIRQDITIVGVLPHMHQTGVHMKVVANSSVDGEVVIYDGPYDFESQQTYDVDFVEMREGDVVEVDCTYENDTDETIRWGDSSLDEMCFAGLQHFPAIDDGSFTCFD